MGKIWAKTYVLNIPGILTDLALTDVTVDRCEQHTYLRSVFTQDGSVVNSVKMHVRGKAVTVDEICCLCW